LTWVRGSWSAAASLELHDVASCLPSQQNIINTRFYACPHACTLHIAQTGLHTPVFAEPSPRTRAQGSLEPVYSCDSLRRVRVKNCNCNCLVGVLVFWCFGSVLFLFVFGFFKSFATTGSSTQRMIVILNVLG
jgi:hypothetical protein